MESRLHNGIVRASVLCAFQNAGKLLISEGYDQVKKEIFHRLLGGGIEFGEKSETALRREMMEELGAEIKNLKYLGTIENIFEWEGRPGHEILLIYDGEFSDANFYEKDFLEVLDRRDAKVYWKRLSDFTKNNDVLYPEEIRNLLQNKL